MFAVSWVGPGAAAHAPGDLVGEPEVGVGRGGWGSVSNPGSCLGVPCPRLALWVCKARCSRY